MRKRAGCHLRASALQWLLARLLLCRSMLDFSRRPPALALAALCACAAAGPALASPGVLAEAKKHLAAGRLTDVLVLLRPDEGNLAKGEETPAARLLAAATEKAVAKQQPELALQLAEASFELDAGQPRVLELLGTWALEDGKVAQARRYSEFWVGAAPGDDRARALQAKASAAIQEKGSLGSTIANIFRGGLAKVKAEAPRAGAAKSDGVIIYTTSWCPACKKAKEWMRNKRVAFVEKDLEKQPEARAELSRKAAKAGFHERGVPVLDAYGTLTDGFSSQTYAALLKIQE